MRFMDWVRGKGRCAQDIVVPFCSKKVGTDISRIFSVLRLDCKNFVPFFKMKLERTKPAYSRVISLIVPFVPLFYKPLYTREEGKKKTVYKNVLSKKTGTIGTTGFSVENHREISVPFCSKKLEQNWNKTGTCTRKRPLFPCTSIFYSAYSARLWLEIASDKPLTCGYACFGIAFRYFVLYNMHIFAT